MKKKKFFLILFFTISLAIFWVNFSFAQISLETTYPKFGNVEATPYLPDYVKYIYYAIIGISGIAAFAVIIRAGFNYLTSSGQPEKIKTAREQIIAAISGLIILFGSWLIVKTINPELIILKMTPIEGFIPELPAGVAICSKPVPLPSAKTMIEEFYREGTSSARRAEIRESLLKIFEVSENFRSCNFTVTTNTPNKITSEIKYIFIMSEEKGKEFQAYGAILYSKPDFKGKTGIFFPPSPSDIVSKVIEGFGPGSTKRIFYLKDPKNKFTDWRITLYKNTNKNQGFGQKPEDMVIFGPKDLNSYYGTKKLSFIPKSIKVEGSAIAILNNSQKKSEKGSSVFVPGEDLNLADLEKHPEISEEVCEEGAEFFRQCQTNPIADTLEIVLGEIF